MTEQERGWLARKVLPGGTEPDPRFTLANERTFLAWIRTSLAFLAGGLALEAFALEAFPEPLRKVLAILLVLTGMLLSAGAAVRWVAIESSMRHGRPLPLPLIVPFLGLAGAVTAGVIVALIILG
ncbi:YidH family protein [Arthrobacter sp. NPDC097144]|uniref:YidH family protein n=1 Tax=Arthrobacter sp. NPDC097144 TaxID=3363946 RepID=UPI00382541F2